MTNWVRVQILGRGSQGEVFLAEPTTGPPHYFAVKVTQFQHSSSLFKEKEILRHFIGCPEIVQCLGSEITVEGDSPDLVFFNLKLEYAAGGSLDDLIRQQKKLPENEVKEYLRMILRGLSCIHGKGFVHVDLKPSNILAFPESDGKMKLKIADFGLSRRCNEDDDKEGEEDLSLPRFRGTPKYMSPESVAFGEINSALDIWSLGCILVKMVSGKSAWDDCPSRKQLMFKLVHEMEIPKIPKELSEEGKDFIGRCFERDPKRRWTADMLLQHPYLTEEKETMKKSDKKLQVRPKELYMSHLRCKIQSNI